MSRAQLSCSQQKTLSIFINFPNTLVFSFLYISLKKEISLPMTMTFDFINVGQNLCFNHPDFDKFYLIPALKVFLLEGKAIPRTMFLYCVGHVRRTTEKDGDPSLFLILDVLKK